MRHRTLRWLTIAAPLLFLALVDVLRHQVWPELLHPWPGFLLVLAVVAGAAWLFSRAVFDRIEQMELRIVGQNRELREVGETARRQATQLRALHEAELALSSDLTLETVLGALKPRKRCPKPTKSPKRRINRFIAGRNALTVPRPGVANRVNSISRILAARVDMPEEVPVAHILAVPSGCLNETRVKRQGL